MSDSGADRASIVASVAPLAGLAVPSHDGLVRVSEAPSSGRLVLRAGPDSAQRLVSALGTALAGRINTAVTIEACTALRLGPDEWLLLADAEGDPWLAARIAEAGRDAPMAVVDVSHRSIGMLVEGPGVEAILAAGCPLPLDIEGFPVGRATRTLLAKAEVVLWRLAPERFHLEVTRSLLPYVVDFLGEVIRSEQAIAAARA